MITKFFPVCIIALIATSAMAADVPKRDVVCGEIIIKGKTPPPVTGKLALRLVKDRPRPVLVFPN